MLPAGGLGAEVSPAHHGGGDLYGSEAPGRTFRLATPTGRRQRTWPEVSAPWGHGPGTGGFSGPPPFLAG